MGSLLSRRAAVIAAAIAALALATSACGGSSASGSNGGSSSASSGGSSSGSSGGSGSSGKTIGLAIADQTSLFFIAAADGVKKAAAEHGYKVLLESANDDSSTQVNQVQDLITHQVSALIYVPAGAAAADVPVIDANNANIPVLTIDREPSRGKIVTFIASNSVAAADQLCTWMAKQIHGTSDILQIEGQLGTTPEVARTQGCTQALANYPNIHTVAKQAANWDENQAFAAAQNMLSAHPNVAAIFGHSDAMSLGAAKAAQQAGKKPVIVGVDGFPTMFQALKSGQVSATEAQQPYHMGQLAVQDAILALQGKASSIPRTQYVPTVLVTKANVNHYIHSDFYGPLGP